MCWHNHNNINTVIDTSTQSPTQHHSHGIIINAIINTSTLTHQHSHQHTNTSTHQHSDHMYRQKMHQTCKKCIMARVFPVSLAGYHCRNFRNFPFATKCFRAVVRHLRFSVASGINNQFWNFLRKPIFILCFRWLTFFEKKTRNLSFGVAFILPTDGSPVREIWSTWDQYPVWYPLTTFLITFYAFLHENLHQIGAKAHKKYPPPPF
jgi:hypothetical protein